MTTAALETYVEHIDNALTSAMAALHGARAAANRSPNAANIKAEQHAEDRVNDLLDKRLRATR